MNNDRLQSAPGRWAGVELLLLVAVAGWSVLVLVHLAYRLHGGALTGADGPFPADQLQYLAWARESGEHILAGDLFEIPPGTRVFIQPMWLLSGLAWRAGAPMVVVALMWKPVAVIALVLAVRAYAARMGAIGAWERTAVVLLAIGYVSPIILLTDRGASLSGEIFTADQLWGYLPTVLAVALMPVYLLALERAIATGGSTRKRALAIVGGTAILLGWLHPWQGETIAVITGGLLLWRRLRSGTQPLLLGLTASLLPLAGYFALSRFDASWRLAEAAENIAPASFIDLLAALAPIAAIALAGFWFRRMGDDIQEQALVLWPLATLLQYFVLAPSFRAHALEGIAIPLAVMTARAVKHLARGANASSRYRRSMPTLLLGALALVLTIPGAIHVARTSLHLIGSGQGGQIVNPSERSALSYLARVPGAAGVLAPSGLGALVPAFTGKPTWVGHPAWTPDFGRRAQFAAGLAAAAIPPALARDQIERSGARYVLLGCRSRRINSLLAPLVAGTHRFGCAFVYVLRAERGRVRAGRAGAPSYVEGWR